MTAARPVVAGGAAVAAAVAVRRRWGRHVARIRTGAPPVVRVSDGLNLHVEVDEGPVNEPTVVLVHGLAARLEEFAAQRDALRGTARVVLYDQRGHGRSGWRGYTEASVDRLGDDLGDVLDALTAAAPVVLVGHSMGGMAVMSLAERRPDLFGTKVVGVALLSTSPGHLMRTAVPGDVERLLIRTRMATLLARLVWLVAPVTDRVRPFRTVVGRRWLRHKMFGRGEPPKHVVDAMQDMWSSSSHTTMSAFYASLLTHDKGETLSRMRDVPALVLAGTADATIPHRHSERIAEEIGQSAKLVLVPDAGHMVNVTHADLVNAELAALLERARQKVRSRV